MRELKIVLVGMTFVFLLLMNIVRYTEGYEDGMTDGKAVGFKTGFVQGKRAGLALGCYFDRPKRLRIKYEFSQSP